MGSPPNIARRRRFSLAAAASLLAAVGACASPNPLYQGVTGDAAGAAERSTDAGRGPDGSDGGAPAPEVAPDVDPFSDTAPSPDLAPGLPVDASPDTGAPDLAADLAPDLAADLPLDLPPDLPRDLPPDLAPDRPPDLPPDLPPDTPFPTARYHFEQNTQGWQELRTRPNPPTISRSTVRAWDGQASLQVDLVSNASATRNTVGIAQEFRAQLPRNTPITFRLWLPTGTAIEYVQPFVLYYQSGDADGNPGWGGIDPPLFTTDLVRGGWNTITHRVPGDSDARGVVEVGIEFVLRPSTSATAFIDAVTW